MKFVEVFSKLDFKLIPFYSNNYDTDTFYGLVNNCNELYSILRLFNTYGFDMEYSDDDSGTAHVFIFFIREDFSTDDLILHPDFSKYRTLLKDSRIFIYKILSKDSIDSILSDKSAVLEFNRETGNLIIGYYNFDSNSWENDILSTDQGKKVFKSITDNCKRVDLFIPKNMSYLMSIFSD